jgi:hypothetical protein
MSVGRNDPCPCGSGQKYKKCCLVADQPKPADLFWHRLHSSRNALIYVILDHAVKTYGKSAISEAWNEFHLWNDEPFEPQSDENQVFMPWFFYDWTPDPEETTVLATAPKDISPAQSLLNTKGGYLEPLQREYIEACLAAPFSFFEIVSCRPGQGYELKDIFTGEILEVIEKKGSEKAGIGYILFGKPVTLNQLTTMEASAPFLIPPVHKAPFLKLRKAMARYHKPINHEALRDYSIEMIELYRMFYEQLLNPQSPTLSNTDGDPFLPQKVIFEIDSPMEAFHALKGLNFQETEERLLQDIEFDAEKKFLKVEIAWLKKGNKQNKAWDNTVLGHIAIEKSTIRADVNSEKRAKLFRKIMKERLGEKARYKATLIEPIESAIGRKSLRENEDSELDGSEQERLMSMHPELQAKMIEMATAHWDGWIYEKVPALGNKTPIQAAKTKDGKEMLEALLTQFERESVNRPQPGVTVKTFKKIREKLGLIRP